MRPSFIPEATYAKKEAMDITQVWHKSGVCPDNTVPIRRTKKEDILRAKSIESFGKKTHRSLGKGTRQSNPGEGHEVHLLCIVLVLLIYWWPCAARKIYFSENKIIFNI